MEPSYTVKEVVEEIKEDLKDFRNKYDTDQKKRDDDISKRPTRVELWSLVAGAGTLVGLALAMTGG